MAFDLDHLIIGGDSAIGGAILRRLRENGANVGHTSRRGTPGAIPFDLNSEPGSWRLPIPRVAYLCAARSTLAECENDPMGSARINVAQTRELAAWLVGHGSFVVFPSSSAVFDGRVAAPDETHTVSPMGAYGRQKAECETCLLALGHTAILRLTKVLDTGHPRIRQWRTDLEQGREIHALTELRLAPISLDFAAEAMIAAGKTRRSCILHLSGATELSWFDLACALASKRNAAPTLVQPAFAPPGLHLPVHATLNMARTADILGLHPQTLDELIGSLCPQ